MSGMSGTTISRGRWRCCGRRCLSLRPAGSARSNSRRLRNRPLRHARMPAAHRRRLVLRPPQGGQARPGENDARLALSAPLVAQLRAHRRRQNSHRIATPGPWEDWDLVFAHQPASRSTLAMTGKTSARSSRPRGVRETRVHDARHTAGALLLEQGIDIRVVQQILGQTGKRLVHAEPLIDRSRSMSTMWRSRSVGWRPPVPVAR